MLLANVRSYYPDDAVIVLESNLNNFSELVNPAARVGLAVECGLDSLPAAQA